MLDIDEYHITVAKRRERELAIIAKTGGMLTPASGGPPIVPAPRRAKLKPVRCVDTGDVYPSCALAAKAMQRTKQTLCNAILSGKTCRGFRWEYLTREKVK